MRRVTVMLLTAMIPGCASDRGLERKVDSLTAQVKSLRADLERSRTAARITLSMKGAKLRAVLAEIARQANVSVVLEDDVDGVVTVDVQGVAWDVVLETVVKTLGRFRVVYDGTHRARILRHAHPPDNDRY